MIVTGSCSVFIVFGVVFLVALGDGSPIDTELLGWLEIVEVDDETKDKVNQFKCCVCVSACLCECMHERMFARVHASVHACLVHACVFVCSCMHAGRHVFVHSCRPSGVCAVVHRYMQY